MPRARTQRAIQVVALLVVQVVVLFGSAGTARWPEAWLFLALYCGLLGGAGVALLARVPEAAATPSGLGGTARADRVILPLLVLGALGPMAVAGLARRLGWPPVLPPGCVLAGSALLTVGYGVVVWAMHVNRFFLQAVRLQPEAGQYPVTAGPYRLVRHPGYAGMLVSLPGGVLVLRSPWAAIPAGLYVWALVWRTAVEDTLLCQELPGYCGYAERTRHRLLPGVW